MSNVGIRTIQVGVNPGRTTISETPGTAFEVLTCSGPPGSVQVTPLGSQDIPTTEQGQLGALVVQPGEHVCATFQQLAWTSLAACTLTVRIWQVRSTAYVAGAPSGTPRRVPLLYTFDGGVQIGGISGPTAFNLSLLSLPGWDNSGLRALNQDPERAAREGYERAWRLGGYIGVKGVQGVSRAWPTPDACVLACYARDVTTPGQVPAPGLLVHWCASRARSLAGFSGHAAASFGGLFEDAADDWRVINVDVDAAGMTGTPAVPGPNFHLPPGDCEFILSLNPDQITAVRIRAALYATTW